jgi:hypothetical protein
VVEHAIERQEALGRYRELRGRG